MLSNFISFGKGGHVYNPKSLNRCDLSRSAFFACLVYFKSSTHAVINFAEVSLLFFLQVLSNFLSSDVSYVCPDRGMSATQFILIPDP